jgi:hypothetical protein
MPIPARITAVILISGHFPEMITYGAQNIIDNVRRIFLLGGFPFVRSANNEKGKESLHFQETLCIVVFNLIFAIMHGLIPLSE